MVDVLAVLGQTCLVNAFQRAGVCADLAPHYVPFCHFFNGFLLLLMNACLLNSQLACVCIDALDPGWILLLETTLWSSASNKPVTAGRVPVLHCLAKLTWRHIVKELA